MTTQSTTEASPEARIPRRWLPAVRLIWLASVFTLMALFIASLSPYYNALRVVCAGEACNYNALSPQEAEVLRELGLSMEQYAVYTLGYEIFFILLIVPPAVLIFRFRSDSWMGTLVSLTLVFFVVSGGVSIALLNAYPQLSSLLNLLDSITLTLFVLLFYLFPDGRFVPRWTRVIAFVLGGTLLVEHLLPNRGSLDLFVSDRLEVGFLLLGCLIVGAYAQVYRYRRVSTPTQHQQTKWVVFGLIVAFSVFLTWILITELYPPQPSPVNLVLSKGILPLLYAIFPLSVTISVLRYRLWDIDIVINRVLVYGLLTGVLAAVYFGSIVVLQSLFRALTGQGESPAVTVVSTLAIAALFSPTRRRIQNAIDRRFYRRKYDAEKTLAAFAAAAREEVETEKLTGTLLAVVEETMQPERASLWLTGDRSDEP